MLPPLITTRNRLRGRYFKATMDGKPFSIRPTTINKKMEDNVSIYVPSYAPKIKEDSLCKYDPKGMRS